MTLSNHTPSNSPNPQPRLHEFILVLLAVFGVAPVCVASGPLIAVIDDRSAGDGGLGDFFCDLVESDGYVCTLFPSSGPDGSIDGFDLVIDLSNIWTDADGLLADHMRAGKSVLVWGAAAFALGINDNVVVQGFIGADMASGGSNKLITTATDPILGVRPVGTVIEDCQNAVCSAVEGTDAHPGVKVLARFEGGGAGIGLMRNTWEGGLSVYMSSAIIPTIGNDDALILGAVRALAPKPIPAVSDWGLVITALLVATAGSILLRTRNRLAPCLRL